MRVCSKCKIGKSEEEFNFKIKSKGLRSYHCRDCSRKYIKSHYENHKKYYLEKAYKRNFKIRDEIKTFTWHYLSNNPCVDCGERDPIVLEFDHMSDKIANISEMYRSFTLEKVKLEIKKCQIRCANCHRRKTARDFGWNIKFAPTRSKEIDLKLL